MNNVVIIIKTMPLVDNFKREFHQREKLSEEIRQEYVRETTMCSMSKKIIESSKWTLNKVFYLFFKDLNNININVINTLHR
jgi:hypothetical protein